MRRPATDWGANIGAFLIVLFVNGVANSVPIGGQTTGEVSARYASLFTPAGFTFSIWGLIYLSLAGFVVYQALPSQRDSELIAGIGRLFTANCLANGAWIFFWHYEQIGLSLIMMIAILVSLIFIYMRLVASKPLTWGQRIFVGFPFSIYTAWICVATIANISAYQTSMGLNSYELSALDWTLIKLALAGAIGATVCVRCRDIPFVLVIGWAAYGIAAKQAGTLMVAGAASTLATLTVLLAAGELLRSTRPHRVNTV